MRPRIATSFRSHGKWGDYLACVIPAIWCYNILVNSSFILRLMEWQNESSLFSVRVRGRQWYWVYKFELKTVVDLLSIPKNLGRNKWLINTGGSYETSDNYFYALKLRSQNNNLKNYWNQYIRNLDKLNELSLYSYIDSYSFESNKVVELDSSSLVSKPVNSDFFKNIFKSTWEFEAIYKPNYFFVDNISLSKNFEETNLKTSLKDQLGFNMTTFFKYLLNKDLKLTPFILKKKLTSFLSQDLFIEKKKNFILLNTIDVFLNQFTLKHQYNMINLNVGRFDTFETSRFFKRRVFEAQPILITKNFINNANFSENNELENIISINFNKEKSVEKKMLTDQYYLVLKQKRYKRKKNIPLRIKHVKNYEGKTTQKNIKFSDQPYLTAQRIFNANKLNVTKLYRALKKNKLRHEQISIQFSRRLLRTKKTLVLPAHVNLTLISNSYDVVHSWFIPAMGIKIDCVPGRATHHSFYCDSVGFFYGQCAEICGRYHHHMPIRLCALPFDQFLVWWYHFGLPKMLFSKPKNRFETSYGQKAFFW